MASDFAEFCLHIRRLQTRIARCVYWINIPLALLNFILVQLDGFRVLPSSVRPLLASWILSLVWLVVSVVHLMLLAEFWEMWWNLFARNAYASEDSKMWEGTRQSLLEDSKRVVRRAFGLAS
jgi:membrane protein YdbS with pleckstrin-like domain